MKSIKKRLSHYIFVTYQGTKTLEAVKKLELLEVLVEIPVWAIVLVIGKFVSLVQISFVLLLLPLAILEKKGKKEVADDTEV